MTSAPRMAATPNRTAVQWVSLVFGIGFLLVALLGFAASGMNMEADPNLAPKIFNTFPVNLVHNLVHLAFGVWGLAASRSHGASRAYARIAGLTYLVLTALGYLVPNGFGLVPIGGADIGLHLVLGIVLTVVGLMAKDTRPVGAPV